MDNPGKKLKAYLTRHHPNLQLSSVRSSPREGSVDVTATFKSGPYTYELMIGFPRSAPEDGRPLCLHVYRNRKHIWSFERDVRPYIGLQKKVRVHLYEVYHEKRRAFMLVVVNEGQPDTIISVLRLDGEQYPYQIEALLKTQIGKLWGMRTELSTKEQVELEKLLPNQPKK